jgi:hypothetical protein
VHARRDSASLPRKLSCDQYIWSGRASSPKPRTRTPLAAQDAVEQTKEAVRQEADTAACKPDSDLAGLPWLRRLQDALARPLGSLYSVVSTRVATLSPAAAPGAAGAAAPNAAAAALDTATVAAMRRKLIGPNTVRAPRTVLGSRSPAAVTLT